jgi:hypothetical protein
VFKRNLTYATYILVGAIGLELVYGKATDAFWAASNSGVSNWGRQVWRGPRAAAAALGLVREPLTGVAHPTVARCRWSCRRDGQ